jgi:hypothetical protein
MEDKKFILKKGAGDPTTHKMFLLVILVIVLILSTIAVGFVNLKGCSSFYRSKLFVSSIDEKLAELSEIVKNLSITVNAKVDSEAKSLKAMKDSLKDSLEKTSIELRQLIGYNQFLDVDLEIMGWSLKDFILSEGVFNNINTENYKQHFDWSGCRGVG